MSTLYIQVPGTRGRLVTLHKLNERTMRNRNTRNIVAYAKRLAVMAAGVEGHGYAEVWERIPRRRIYAVGNADR